MNQLVEMLATAGINVWEMAFDKGLFVIAE